ncbi:diguanylate cyclase domain-containing protein [Agarivorans sp. Z349TD_8]|uniref:HAMP domain-containing protein n=1 Tax=Agarivorans sp. Z349TD_8 TaxID=3421434 RepID=UPI003D7DD2EA
MSNSISLRLGLWFSMFGILASIVTATISYHESRGLLSQSAERELATTTQILTREFSRTIDEIAKDARFLSAIPQTVGYFSTLQPAEFAEQLNSIFSQKLKLNSSYFQIRFIGAADFGRELIRVDRLSSGVVSRSPSELEEKAHYPYVFRTLRLSPDEVYLSDIEIHTEQGLEVDLHHPTLKVASPVYVDGQTLGLVVINVSLTQLFSLLQADLPKGVDIYLSNQHGDYLVNPDSDKQFGFHFGHRYLIQQDFPEMEALFSNHQPLTYVLPSSVGVNYQRAVSFTALFYGSITNQKMAVLGLASPLPSLSAIMDVLAGSMIKVCLGLSLLGLLTSLLFARILSMPIRNMVAAVKDFSAGQSLDQRLLPSDRNDEIGLLANSFYAMSQQINLQIKILKDNETNLRHLASHDGLTGLPNRALFLEQLNASMRQAQLSETQLAVVFIDLDDFKQVNDSFGHAAGDQLLQQVAQVVRDTIRAEDSVARFAGDEFMLALTSIDQHQDASSVVNKVLSRLAEEIYLDTQVHPVYASVGISIYPGDGINAEMLIRNADAAMYKAKEKGRNCFCFYDLKSAQSNN